MSRMVQKLRVHSLNFFHLLFPSRLRPQVKLTLPLPRLFFQVLAEGDAVAGRKATLVTSCCERKAGRQEAAAAAR